jgi:hypothetical protein
MATVPDIYVTKIAKLILNFSEDRIYQLCTYDKSLTTTPKGG